jgi:hypothetical protein
LRHTRSHHVDHGVVELGRFVDEGLMPGPVEPEHLFDGALSSAK